MAPPRKNPQTQRAERARLRLARAVERREELKARGDEELARAIEKARSAGLSVREIAELVGFSTRRAVYDALERGQR
jgi:hypothetical protein